MNRWASHLVVGVVAFAAGGLVWRGEAEVPAEQASPTEATDRTESTTAVAGSPRSAGVTGIGGVFFKSADPASLVEWYRTHLGIDASEWGGFAFQWGVAGRPDEIGYTIWTPFPEATTYFSPGEESFMVNYRVADLAGLIEALRADGVEIVGEIQEAPNGAFAWIRDLEGRKVELWEPIGSSEDPYLLQPPG